MNRPSISNSVDRTIGPSILRPSNLKRPSIVVVEEESPEKECNVKKRNESLNVKLKKDKENGKGKGKDGEKKKERGFEWKKTFERVVTEDTNRGDLIVHDDTQFSAQAHFSYHTPSFHQIQKMPRIHTNFDQSQNPSKIRNHQDTETFIEKRPRKVILEAYEDTYYNSKSCGSSRSIRSNRTEVNIDGEDREASESINDDIITVKKPRILKNIDEFLSDNDNDEITVDNGTFSTVVTSTEDNCDCGNNGTDITIWASSSQEVNSSMELDDRGNELVEMENSSTEGQDEMDLTMKPARIVLDSEDSSMKSEKLLMKARSSSMNSTTTLVKSPKLSTNSKWTLMKSQKSSTNPSTSSTLSMNPLTPMMKFSESLNQANINHLFSISSMETYVSPSKHPNITTVGHYQDYDHDNGDNDNGNGAPHHNISIGSEETPEKEKITVHHESSQEVDVEPTTSNECENSNNVNLGGGSILDVMTQLERWTQQNTIEIETKKMMDFFENETKAIEKLAEATPSHTLTVSLDDIDYSYGCIRFSSENKLFIARYNQEEHGELSQMNAITINDVEKYFIDGTGYWICGITKVESLQIIKQ